MKEEIQFLYDDKLGDDLEEINRILSELQKIDFETRRREVILRTFTKAILKSLMKERPREFKSVLFENKLQPQMIKKYYPVSQRRLVHVPTGAEVWPIPIPTPEESKPVSIKEFKIIPKYTPKVIESTTTKEKIEEVYQPKTEIKPQLQSYALTVEPGTNKALALAEVSFDYKVLEPMISEQDLDLISETKEKIRKKPQKFLDDDNKLTKLMKKICDKKGIPYSEDYKRRIKYYLIRDLIYFGKLDPLLRDNKVTKITCDGPGTPLIVEYESKNLDTNITFKDAEKLNELIKDIALKLNQKISEAEPILDAIYKDFKLQATLGTAFSTPKFTFVKQKDINLLPPKA